MLKQLVFLYSMSQPRKCYARKCNASTSLTVDKVVGSKVKTEAITMETPPNEQPQGVKHLISGHPEEEGEFWPLSGKPHFDVIITKSHLSSLYEMIIPTRIQKELPCATVPVVVTYCGKKWDMIYIYNHVPRRFQSAGWKIFAVDNHLKIGDACVFELVECSNDCIKFKVQILRGDFPAELLARTEGLTKENPLTI